MTLTDPRLFRQSCYVDGAWVGARSGATIPVDNPATGAVVGAVPRLSGIETREAIAASSFFMAEESAKERGDFAPLVRLMIANRDDLGSPRDDRAGGSRWLRAAPK